MGLRGRRFVSWAVTRPKALSERMDAYGCALDGDGSHIRAAIWLTRDIAGR